jgi:putative flippase GtrA
MNKKQKSKKQKEAVIKLMGGIGIIVLLTGLFTSLYPFTTGLLISIAIGILTGVLAKYWGVKK